MFSTDKLIKEAEKQLVKTYQGMFNAEVKNVKNLAKLVESIPNAKTIEQAKQICLKLYSSSDKKSNKQIHRCNGEKLEKGQKSIKSAKKTFEQIYEDKKLPKNLRAKALCYLGFSVIIESWGLMIAQGYFREAIGLQPQQKLGYLLLIDVLGLQEKSDQVRKETERYNMKFPQFSFGLEQSKKQGNQNQSKLLQSQLLSESFTMTSISSMTQIEKEQELLISQDEDEILKYLKKPNSSYEKY